MKNFEHTLVEHVKNRYKFRVTVEQEYFNTVYAKVTEELGKKVKIPGFRPGMAPKNLLENEVGYKAYSETVRRILPECAIEIIKEESLNPISSLDYEIEDVDQSKNVVYTFSFINQPVIDPQKIEALRVEYTSPTVSDSEVDVVIKNIIKNSLPREKWENNIVKAPQVETSHTNEHKHHDHNHEHGHDHGVEDITITDELVAAVGYQEEQTYEGLKKRVHETLVKIKEEESENDFATKVVNEAIKVADFEVPSDFVNREVDNKLEQFRQRLAQLKIDEATYLSTQGITLEQMQADWKYHAEQDIAADLLLVNYASQANLVPSDEEVDQEIEAITDETVKKQYKDRHNRDYLRTALTRNRGLRKLLDTARVKSEK